MANNLSVGFQQQSVSTWGSSREMKRYLAAASCSALKMLQQKILKRFQSQRIIWDFSVVNSLDVLWHDAERCVQRNPRLEWMGYPAYAVTACFKVAACACLQSLKSTHATICFGLERLRHWRAFGRPLLSKQSHSRKTVFLWLVVILNQLHSAETWR